MDARAYWEASLPTTLLVCLCLAQAFGYRLRRAITAFYFPKVNSQTTLLLNMHTHSSLPALCPTPLLYHYHCVPLAPQPTPQREKKRVLFLYNDLLRKRAAFTKLRRAAIVRRARHQRASVSTDPGNPTSPPLGLKTLREGASFSAQPVPLASQAFRS